MSEEQTPMSMDERLSMYEEFRNAERKIEEELTGLRKSNIISADGADAVSQALSDARFEKRFEGSDVWRARRITYLENTLEVLNDITLKFTNAEPYSGTISFGKLKAEIVHYMQGELTKLKGQVD